MRQIQVPSAVGLDEEEGTVTEDSGTGKRVRLGCMFKDEAISQERIQGRVFRRPQPEPGVGEECKVTDDRL